MFIFPYTVFRNSSISDEHVLCVALHFTRGLALKNKTKKKFSSYLARELLFYLFSKLSNYLRECFLPLRANDVAISTAPNAPSPKLLTSPVSGKVDLFAWLLCELLEDWLDLELVLCF